MESKNSYEPSRLCREDDGLVIQSVRPDSPGDELGLEPGDRILEINGNLVSDELDWIYLTLADELLIAVEKKDGEVWEVDPELDEDEDMGLSFEQTLSSKTCSNHCLFCFIDQNPEGMRETLYIKDDDERLSFLNGNYITLTNLGEKEFDRIKKWKIPVNISIHATRPETRIKLLRNACAGNILERLQELKEAGVEMNGQIVLVPGINDKSELSKTLDDLSGLYPELRSVSVVPFGMTKYREGLFKVAEVDKKEAEDVLERIARVQDHMLRAHGTRFVFPSDEFFLTAEEELPDSSWYEGFPQLENGVGMLTDFMDEARRRMTELQGKAPEKSALIITGKLAGDSIEMVLRKARKQWRQSAGLEDEVLRINNDFYGEKITVSGLVTGQDILAQAAPVLEKKHFDRVLIPDTMIKNGTQLFLDDLTVQDLEEKLGSEIVVVPADGRAFVDALYLG